MTCILQSQSKIVFHPRIGFNNALVESGSILDESKTPQAVLLRGVSQKPNQGQRENLLILWNLVLPVLRVQKQIFLGGKPKRGQEASSVFELISWLASEMDELRFKRGFEKPRRPCRNHRC